MISRARVRARAEGVRPTAPYGQRDNDLGEALELLQEARYSEFSLEQLAAVRQTAAFRELANVN
jgi:hypothetical protein